MNCPRAPARYSGMVTGTLPEFNQVQAESRKRRIKEYMQRSVPDEEEKQELCRVLLADLRDLGIKL
jgi:hypothetical protein